LKAPKLGEELVRERILNTEKTEDQLKLEDYSVRMTNTTFNKLLRFFKAISKPPASGMD
jgi:hypothetical protein